MLRVIIHIISLSSLLPQFLKNASVLTWVTFPTKISTIFLLCQGEQRALVSVISKSCPSSGIAML
jgi:hypothetical protein